MTNAIRDIEHAGVTKLQRIADALNARVRDDGQERAVVEGVKEAA